MPFVQVADVSDDMKLVDDTKQKISKLAQPMSVCAEEGSVLVTLQGSIGRVAIAQYKAFVDRTVLIFDKYTANIDKIFWAYIIKEKFIEEARKAPGGTIKTITKEVLSDFDLMLPSYDEQKMLGKLLNSLDNLITLHQRKSFYNIANINVWEQRKLEDVVDIGSGMDYKHLGDGDIPVYGTGGYMLSVDKALSDDKDAIGIGRKGTIDKPYILRAPFWTVDTLFYCIPKKDYDLDFTSCLFQNINWKKKDESTGVPSLSKIIINNVEALTPTFDEQKQIGQYFSNLDHLITLHRRAYHHIKRRTYKC